MASVTLPAPRLIDAHAVRPLRFGIIGPGGIAAAFTNAITKHTPHRVVAVASRTPGKAENFALPRGIEHTFDSYEAMVGHPDVDAVYVSTTHDFHLAHALLAIAAGRHVLIEKPCALSSADVDTIAASARAAGVLAMEAMWSSYLPQADVIRQVISDGMLGDISLVQTDFGENLRAVPRLMSTASGGALLDLGVYNFAFTSMVLGGAQSVTTVGSLAGTGVDDTTTSFLSYASGARAVATSSLSTFTRANATISGSTAMLTVDAPYFVPTGLTLLDAGFNPAVRARWEDTTPIARTNEAMCYEATAFASYVEQGLLDSPIRPLAQVAHDIDLLTQARHQVGAYLDGEVR